MVNISYSCGTQNPVRIICSNYYGDARVRYTDAQGAENDINFLRNNDITYTITHSVYQNNDIKVKKKRYLNNTRTACTLIL